PSCVHSCSIIVEQQRKAAATTSCPLFFRRLPLFPRAFLAASACRGAGSRARTHASVPSAQRFPARSGLPLNEASAIHDTSPEACAAQPKSSLLLARPHGHWCDSPPAPPPQDLWHDRPDSFSCRSRSRDCG